MRGRAWCVALALFTACRDGSPTDDVGAGGGGGDATASEGEFDTAAAPPDAGTSRSASESSDELIDAALARGDLDPETALKYRVFAAFGDPRLPAAYRSSLPQIGGTRAIGAVAARFGTLSAATQAELFPFLLPPSAEGSWLARRDEPEETPGRRSAPLTEAWRPHPAAGGAATVWSETGADAAIARSIATALTGTIWKKLFGELRMPPPLSDRGRHLAGPDGGLDIYLVPSIADRGLTVPYLPAGCEPGTPVTSACSVCSAVPVKILVRPNIDHILGTVAHEVMHASQYTYKVKNGCSTKGEYDWWMEATGQWAHDYVYPETQYEHMSAGVLQASATLPIEAGSILRQYGAYLFPFFLRHAYDASLVRSSWEKTVAAGHLEAIDQALSAQGGWKEVWPDFAVDLINAPPRTHFTEWDKLPSQVDYEQGGTLSTPAEDKQVISIDLALDHLSARHIRYEVDTKTLGSLEYEGPPLGDTGRLTVLYRVGDAWEVQDWTEPGKHRFCFNKAAERVEELVLVYSNSEWRNASAVLRPSSKPKLTAVKAPCTCAGALAVKTFHGRVTFHSSEQGGGMGFSTVSSMSSGEYEFDAMMQKNAPFGTGGVAGGGPLTGTGSIHDRSVATEPNSPDVVHTLDGDGAPNPPGASTATVRIEPTAPGSDVCKYSIALTAVIDAVDDAGQTQSSMAALYVNDIPLGDFTGTLTDTRAVPILIYAVGADGTPAPASFHPGGFATQILFVLKYGPGEVDLSKPVGSANVSWTLTATDPARE